MMLSRLPEDAGAYLAQGLAWFVVEGDGPVARLCDAWIRGGDAREAARFGSLRVVELLGR